MKIVNYKDNEQVNKIHGVKTSILYNYDSAMSVHITLEAGEQLKPHITPVDVFFFVLEGEPTIQVGEEKQKVSANHLVESPKDIKHCLFNETETVARILVVKAPKPTKSTKIL